MVPAGAPLDGRTARSQRTRVAVVDALVSLIEEGNPRPQVQAIADRAGISSRAVHLHFKTIADLHRALVDRTTSRIVEHLSIIDPGEPLTIRVDVLCAQRARINEEVGALLRAADIYEQTSPTIAAGRDLGRQASRDQLNRIFAGELEARAPGSRSRVIAAIDALLTHTSWILLRRTHELSSDQARIATRDAVLTLLAHDLGAP